MVKGNYAAQVLEVRVEIVTISIALSFSTTVVAINRKIGANEAEETETTAAVKKLTVFDIHGTDHVSVLDTQILQKSIVRRIL